MNDVLVRPVSERTDVLTRWVVAALAAVLVGSAMVAFAPRSEAASGGVSFGVDYRDDAHVAAVDSALGTEVESIRVFKALDAAPSAPTLRPYAERGTTVLLTIRSIRRNGQLVPWADVASTRWGDRINTEIRDWAIALRDFPGEVVVTFNHEPETQANLALGDSEDFKGAWRRFVQIFRDMDADNVTFLWTMTDYAFEVPATDRRAADKWYPGDWWVDSLGTTTYNWFTCRDGRELDWRDFEGTVEGFRRWAADHPDKDIWFPEIGSVVDPANPARRGEWILDAVKALTGPGWGNVRGIVWFDQRDVRNDGRDCDWRLGSNGSAVDAARDVILGRAETGGGGDGGQPPVSGRAVLAVGNTNSLTSGERLVRDELQAIGLTVQLRNVNNVVAALPGAEFVWIGPSLPGSVRNQLRATTIPVITTKPWGTDWLDLGPPATRFNATTVTIERPLARLAAGQTGTVQVLPSGGRMYGFDAGGQAAVVATAGGRDVIAIWREGQFLADGSVAAGCRIAQPWDLRSNVSPNATGRAMIQEAARLAVDAC